MKKLIVSFVIMITIPAFAFCAQLDHKQNKGQSLQEFWSVFRGEVLAGDKKKIASMTKFPFKTRGVSDDDPIITHNRDSFIRMLDRLLKHDPGLRREPDTMRDLVERTVIVPKKYIFGDMFRIGDFCFEKTQGIWHFTKAYTDDDT
jgi:hypothetical protein